MGNIKFIYFIKRGDELLIVYRLINLDTEEYHNFKFGKVLESNSEKIKS